MENGILLGCITYASFVFSFLHFPLAIKSFLLRNHFLTDFLSVIISFLLLTNISKSIAAVIAAILCGLLVNLTLIVHKHLF